MSVKGNAKKAGQLWLAILGKQNTSNVLVFDLMNQMNSSDIYSVMSL